MGYKVITQVIGSDGSVLKTVENSSKFKLSPKEKAVIYENELTTGKSVVSGEKLSEGQINFRKGFLDGLIKVQYDYGFNAAKKQSKKKNKRKRYNRKRYKRY